MLYFEKLIPQQGNPVLNALRSQRNRPYLRVLVCVLLVSWVSMLISARCAMPAQWRVAAADAMPAGCSEPANHSPKHPGHTSTPLKDCSFAPCLDSQPNPAFGFKADKAEMPVFILCLIWLLGCLFHTLPARRIPRATVPPDGRRIRLIYQFCTLLN